MQPDEAAQAATRIVDVLWQSWLHNRFVGGRRERERAFWQGYALGRRQAARQLAFAIGVPDPLKGESPMSDAKPVPCPRCSRRFGDDTALHQHVRVKHGGPRFPSRQRDDDESLADIAVEASIKRASGQKLDPLEESLLS